MKKDLYATTQWIFTPSIIIQDIQVALQCLWKSTLDEYFKEHIWCKTIPKMKERNGTTNTVAHMSACWPWPAEEWQPRFSCRKVLDVELSREPLVMWISVCYTGLSHRTPAAFQNGGSTNCPSRNRDNTGCTWQDVPLSGTFVHAPIV